MVVQTLADPAEFMAELRRSNPRWGDWRDVWVYRGQREDWPLLPTLWRPNRESDPFYRAATGRVELSQYEPARDPHWQRRSEAMLRVLRAEAAGVEAFRRMADNLGFHVPTTPLAEKRYAYWGQDSLSDHEREIDSYLPTHATALAQHHGIATRLLDWTEDPLAAVFFAVNGWIGWRDKLLYERQPLPAQLPDLVIYAFDARQAQDIPREAQFPLAIVRPDRAVNHFMRAQRGLFTWHREAESQFYQTGAWPTHWEPLEAAHKEVKNRRVGVPLIQKIKLKGECVPDLQRLLVKEDVRLVHFMPTLDNVALTVRRDAEWAAEEVPGEPVQSPAEAHGLRAQQHQV